MPKGVYDRKPGAKRRGRPPGRRAPLEIPQDLEDDLTTATDDFERSASHFADAVERFNTWRETGIYNGPFVWKDEEVAREDTEARPEREPSQSYPTNVSAPFARKEFVPVALERLRQLLIDRGREYTSEDEFENFAEQARIAGVTIRQVFRGAIGQKLTREASQRAVDAATIDSITDTAGYAVLWLAYEMRLRSYL